MTIQNSIADGEYSVSMTMRLKYGMQGISNTKLYLANNTP